jgi:hypothetical protein
MIKDECPPILLIAFNRPYETRKVLERIVAAKPKALYVALDAPRVNNETDRVNCANVELIFEASKFDFPIHFLRRRDNLGCKKAVVSAIDWFFENETSGIILEDDIIAHDEFFNFCAIMLQRYECNPDIYAILGFNLYGQNFTSSEYFEYEGFYPWGWATWRDRWKTYSVDNFKITSLIDLRGECPEKRFLINSMILNLSLVQKGLLDTWDYQVLYRILVDKKRTVVHCSNLIQNIGANGAHSVDNQLNFSFGFPEKFFHLKVFEGSVDHFYNDLFLKEHYDNRLKVMLKNLLLKFGLYGTIRGTVKKLRKLKSDGSARW